MPRKLRLEYAGAIYHVINRGNYRTDIFADEGTKEAFELCVFEACSKSGWVLFDFTVMRNHYHLALKTPEPNLVLGMQWLESTFANRFNRFRRENGHVFQGRYHSVMVEDGDALERVCRYIQLNPVRAGVTTVPELRQYRYSSYWYLWHPKRRPSFLKPQAALVQRCGLSDGPKGWTEYEAALALQAEEDSLGRKRGYKSPSKGWYVGSDEFRAELILRHDLAPHARAWGAEGAAEIKRQRWEQLLQRCLGALKKTGSDLDLGRRSEPWKVAVAAFMKERSQASNPWLAKRMRLGGAAYVSRLVCALRNQRQPSRELAALRCKCKAWASPDSPDSDVGVTSSVGIQR